MYVKLVRKQTYFVVTCLRMRVKSEILYKYTPDHNNVVFKNAQRKNEKMEQAKAGRN